MSPAEISDLLDFARGYGLPEPDQRVRTAWHEALHALDFDEAQYAVVDHYRQSVAEVTPADIWSRCRVPEAPPAPEPPKTKPDPKRWHEMWEQALEASGLECAARRALVQGIKPAEGNEEPPLAMRLCDEPLHYKRPSQWGGFIPPELFNGGQNSSPRRVALLDIVADAGRLAAEADAAGERNSFHHEGNDDA